MRTIAIVLVAGIAAMVGRAWGQTTMPTLPTAKVAVVKETPKIDGVLDDAVWKDATVITDFKDPDGVASTHKTRLLLARDDKNLYVAIESLEDPATLKKLVANVKDHNGEDLYMDDSVELFIDPTNHRKSYYHLIINSANVTWESIHEGEDLATGSNDWTPKYQSASKTGEKSWVVEMAIPFDQFDRTPNAASEWAFNFLRNRNVGNADASEHIYWSAIADSAHQPAKFGLLTNMPAWKDRVVKKKLGD